MQPMKFALYQPWIYVKGGLERSLLELVSRSRHQWRIYTSHYEPHNTFSQFAGLGVTQLGTVSVDRKISTVFISALQMLRLKVPTEGCDGLVIWCDGIGDLLTFRNASLPTYTICSTPLRPVFDPVYERLAYGARGIAGKAAYKIFKTAFRLIDRLAWKRYTGVIATSAEVRQRIIAGGLYTDCPRMKLFYPGIDWQALETEVSYEPILLVPGRIMWTKNIGLAIDAFRQAALPAPWRLVVAGFVDLKSRPYLAMLRERSAGLAVDFVNSPGDAEMAALYRRASAVLFPPLNEDWGIVPLEAMAYKKPVLATAGGGPLESVRDGETGFLLPPDGAVWASALQRLAAQPGLVEKMGLQAREHVRRFDWSQFVSGIDDAFEQWTQEDARRTQR
jgi:glycosyltransferase involved in cell wall biosynthesis